MPMVSTTLTAMDSIAAVPLSALKQRTQQTEGRHTTPPKIENLKIKLLPALKNRDPRIWLEKFDEKR